MGGVEAPGVVATACGWLHVVCVHEVLVGKVGEGKVEVVGGQPGGQEWGSRAGLLARLLVLLLVLLLQLLLHALQSLGRGELVGAVTGAVWLMLLLVVGGVLAANGGCGRLGLVRRRRAASRAQQEPSSPAAAAAIVVGAQAQGTKEALAVEAARRCPSAA